MIKLKLLLASMCSTNYLLSIVERETISLHSFRILIAYIKLNNLQVFLLIFLVRRQKNPANIGCFRVRTLKLITQK